MNNQFFFPIAEHLMTFSTRLSKRVSPGLKGPSKAPGNAEGKSHTLTISVESESSPAMRIPSLPHNFHLNEQSPCMGINGTTMRHATNLADLKGLRTLCDQDMRENGHSGGSAENIRLRQNGDCANGPTTISKSAMGLRNSSPARR
jgi:hypothetical protein